MISNWTLFRQCNIAISHCLISRTQKAPMLGILPIDTSFLAWYRVAEIHERRLGFGLGLQDFQMEPHPVPPFNFTNIHPKNSMFQQLIDMHLYNRFVRGIFKKIIFYQQAMLMDHGYILVIFFSKTKISGNYFASLAELENTIVVFWQCRLHGPIKTKFKNFLTIFYF